MRLRLIVVGRGDGELAGFEKRFLSRLAPFADCEIRELPEGRAKQPGQRLAEEADRILRSAGSGFILFDERGKGLSSRQWADFISRRNAGDSVDFVIGGAGGVHELVRRAAGACWKLSPMTLPHQLVRTVVLEQLYRAFTIIRGHPYHRD